MSKFITEVIRFILLIGLFYFINIPIFDFLAPSYENRFELTWSVSIIMTIFVEKLYEIRDLLEKNKKDE